MLLHDKRYHVTVICLSLRLRQITQTSALIIPHPTRPQQSNSNGACVNVCNLLQ